MPTSGHGGPRYPRRSVGSAAERDLGDPMPPAEILIALRRILRLDTEAEVVGAMLAGADAVEAGLARDADEPGIPLRELSVEDRIAAIAAARETTRSRVVAWRKRSRQMTWPELRVLIVGLVVIENE